jgi:hypothetical protein
VIIYNPDGTILASSNYPWGQYFDALTLPATGTYRILVDVSGAETGSVTLTLYDVPPDINTSITIGGSPVTVTTTAPGQNASLTYSGAAGQQATVHVTANSMGCPTISVNNPDGSLLISTNSCSANFNLATQTLVASGTYKIGINPSGTDFGSITIGVTSP